MPKNMRSLELSSGGFSATAVVAGGPLTDDSEAVEGAVEAGEGSMEPEEVEAMMMVYRKCRKKLDIY
jgi:hypothetical protein